MFAKLLALLPDRPGPTPDTVGVPFQQRQLAVAVLLLELAQSDRRIPPGELAAVEAVVRERFGLDAQTASRLVETARTILDAALEDWIFASMIRKTFDAEERVAIFSLLWEVVYADGRLAKLEQDLIEHLERELGLDAPGAELARTQALARVKSRDVVSNPRGTACDS